MSNFLYDPRLVKYRVLQVNNGEDGRSTIQIISVAAIIFGENPRPLDGCR
jgi:hypothetical protein